MRKFTLNTDVKEKIKNIQAKHTFRKEIGGILIGAYDAEIECLRLTDMTFPFPGDQQSRYRFFRKADGHQEIMDQLWEESGHTKAYLGEWHTHDEDTPIPSVVDRKNWKRIAKRNHNFDECFFMIIGKKTFIIWTVMNDDILEIYRENSSDAMMFPETIEEFIDQYKFIDTDQIYTNGSELIQVFRVMQWVEHERALDAVPIRHGHWIRTEAYPHRVVCSECHRTYVRNENIIEGRYKGDEIVPIYCTEAEYCPHCGSLMDEVEE